MSGEQLEVVLTKNINNNCIYKYFNISKPMITFKTFKSLKI